MSVNGYTARFGLGLINFDSNPWHTDDWANLNSLDALLYDAMTSKYPMYVAASVVANTLAMNIPSSTVLTDLKSAPFSFIAPIDNSGPVTLAVNGYGPIEIKQNNSSLAAGQMVHNQVYFVVYDGTVFRLMGRSGELTSSDVATSLGYTPAPASFRNRLVNGTMRIDERNSGASVSPTNGYIIDKWATNSSQAAKFNYGQNLGAATPPTGYTNYLGATSTSAYVLLAADYFAIVQTVEGTNIADFAWGTPNAQPITISGLIKSSVTGTHGGAIRNGAANRSYPFTYNIPVANVWTPISVTIPGDTAGVWPSDITAGLTVSFGLGAGATLSGPPGVWAAANYVTANGAVSVVGVNGATFQITAIQLEPGSYASPNERRPIAVELALCRRYYKKAVSGLIAYHIASLQGMSWEPMRATPTTVTVTTPGAANLHSVRTTSNGAIVDMGVLNITGISASGMLFLAGANNNFSVGAAYDFTMTLDCDF